MADDYDFEDESWEDVFRSLGCDVEFDIWNPLNSQLRLTLSLFLFF